jgi:hypothetical protein
MTAYEKISFEEATRIVYYHYGERPGLFKELMEDLMNNAEAPFRSITPRGYDEYKQYLSENKKSK